MSQAIDEATLEEVKADKGTSNPKEGGPYASNTTKDLAKRVSTKLNIEVDAIQVVDSLRRLNAKGHITSLDFIGAGDAEVFKAVLPGSRPSPT